MFFKRLSCGRVIISLCVKRIPGVFQKALMWESDYQPVCKEDSRCFSKGCHVGEWLSACAYRGFQVFFKRLSCGRVIISLCVKRIPGVFQKALMWESDYQPVCIEDSRCFSKGSHVGEWLSACVYRGFQVFFKRLSCGSDYQPVSIEDSRCFSKGSHVGEWLSACTYRGFHAEL